MYKGEVYLAEVARWIKVGNGRSTDRTEGFIFVLVGGRVVNANDYMDKARKG